MKARLAMPTIISHNHLMPVRILLVEDSRADASLIHTITARSSVPVEIAVAEDPDAALGLLDGSFKPDLIISALVLPRTSGIGLLGRPETKDIPIVIFSSSMNPDAEEALRMGAREFVQKPIDLDGFTETLWKIIWKWRCGIDRQRRNENRRWMQFGSMTRKFVTSHPLVPSVPPNRMRKPAVDVHLNRRALMLVFHSDLAARKLRPTLQFWIISLRPSLRHFRQRRLADNTCSGKLC
jgi:CheY-like chemotaxis protein